MLPVLFASLGTIFALAGALGVLVALSGPREEWRFALPRWRRVADVRSGAVILRGRLESRGQTLRAPLSGVDCLYFQLSASVITSYRDAPLFKLVSAQQGVEAGLNDDSGTAVVQLAEAEYWLPSGSRLRVVRTNSPPEEVRDVLCAADQFSRYRDRVNEALQYEEETILAGDTLTLIAAVNTVTDGQPRLRALPRPILTDSESAKVYLRLFRPTIVATVLSCGFLVTAVLFFWLALRHSPPTIG